MTSIIDYIADYLKARNPAFDFFGINGVQLPSGEVVEFKDGKESRFIGIGDNYGTGAYIRFNPSITHNQADRRLTSSTSGTYLKTCRLVAYTFKDDFESEEMMTKLITDIKQTPFTGFGKKPQILVRKSNHSYYDIAKEELLKDPNSEFVCVAIDFDLRYYAESCLDCDYDTDSQYVKIINQDSTIIKRLLPPESYQVLEFSGIIDNGPPYTNTIVDNG
jgi:hypothetical protein